MQISIRLMREDIYAISPLDFLGETQFKRYQRAVGISFTEYDPDARAYRTKLSSLPQIVDRLRADGFAPVASSDVQERIARMRAKRQVARNEAESRAREAHRELGYRGLGLYPYQFEGVDFLAARNEALLADQMGLGKTVQALLAIPRQARVLIVCPAVVKGVWAKEIERFRPDYRWGIGGPNTIVPAEGEALIITPHFLPEPVLRDSEYPTYVWAGEPLPSKMVLIADEAHMFKTKKAQRTQAFRALAGEVRQREGKVWLLTATPLLNRPQDLWGVLSAGGLVKGAFGTWNNFLALYSAKKTPWGKGYFWGKPSPDVQKAVERVSLRRQRKEVLPELPTKVYKEIPVAVDRKGLRDALDAVRWENADELPPFDLLSKARAKLAEFKTDAAVEIVDQYVSAEEPLIVFSAHRHPIERLRKLGYPVITGDESPEERTEIVAEFQAGWSVKHGKHWVLGATIGAGGIGITLTRAAHVLFVDRDYTPALNEQAEDRVCRIGQDRGVVVMLLIADHPIDRRMTKLLADKRELIEGSLG